MQTTRESGKLLTVRGGWLTCPNCGKNRLLRIRPDTQAKSLPVYCRICRKEIIVNIESQSVERRSQ